MASNGVELRFFTREVTQAIGEAALGKMHTAVNEIRNTTLETLSGTRTGRTYRVPGTGRTYTASAPGEPPAQATGRLRQSIATEVTREGGDIIGRVGTDQSYGKMLEFGTHGGKIKPRPWLHLSFSKTVPKVREILGSRWLP